MQHKRHGREIHHTSISTLCDHDSESGWQCPQIHSREERTGNQLTKNSEMKGHVKEKSNFNLNSLHLKLSAFLPHPHQLIAAYKCKYAGICS